MDSPPPTPLTTDEDRAITATVLRERSRLGNFIRRRVLDRTEAEDILQDVFHEFVQSYRLPEPVEQVGAWLYQVARNRIIDRFRKKKELAFGDMGHSDGIEDGRHDEADLRLDLELPSPEAGPEARYARSRLVAALQQALDELPENQREVFMAHELEGVSFKVLAARTGVGVNTLLARKRYAVLFLQARLQAVYEEFDF